VIQPFELGGTSLSLSAEQLSIFSSRPLLKLFEEFVEFVHIPESVAESLPWNKTLNEHSISKTKLSKETIERLGDEMAKASKKVKDREPGG
jgi:hypothetical protein